jgi:hypothetical protein
MWFGCFQLFVGNYLISVLESAILRRFFRAANPFKMVLAANFTSMFCGFALIWLCQSTVKKADPDPFRFAREIVVGAWVASFVITVLVEAPFFARVLRRDHAASAMWRASIVANAASYAIIVPLAFVLGPTSALRLRAGHTQRMDGLSGWIYYVDRKDRAVRRMRPSGAPDEMVLALGSPDTDRFDIVAVEPDEQGSIARLVLHENDGAKVLNANLGKGSRAGRPWEFYEGYAALSGWLAGGLSFVAGEGASTGFWAFEGLWTGGHHYALETPFIEESWSSPTVLPNGLLLVEVNGGIYLLDTADNMASRIKRGESPSFLRDP